MLRSVRLLVWERANGEKLDRHGVRLGTISAERADLERFPWPFPDWPLDKVLAVYNQVAGRLSDSKGRVKDSWDEQTARLARVILQERAEARFADHWQRMQELKNGGKPAGGVQVTTRTHR